MTGFCHRRLKPFVPIVVQDFKQTNENIQGEEKVCLQWKYVSVSQNQKRKECCLVVWSSSNESGTIFHVSMF